MERLDSTRPLFDAAGHFIPRQYRDGRAAVRVDRIGVAVPVDFRAYLRTAALSAGTTVSDLVREAAATRAAELLSRQPGAA